MPSISDELEPVSGLGSGGAVPTSGVRKLGCDSRMALPKGKKGEKGAECFGQEDCGGEWWVVGGGPVMQQSTGSTDW